MNSVFDSRSSGSIHLGWVFNHWNQQLVGIAHQHLSPAIRRRVDAYDVVQSAFRTVWRRQLNGSIALNSIQRTWHLLVRVTRIKAMGAARFNLAECRSPKREIAEEESHLTCNDAAEIFEQIVCFDEIEQLCRHTAPVLREILQLRLNGHSVAHIATQLGVARQTVYRALQFLRDRYDQLNVEN